MSLTPGTARTTPARAVTSGAARSRQARTSTDPVWRVWITRHRVVAAILAGIVATHMATIIGFFLPAVGLPKLDWPSANGGVFTPYGSAIQQFVSGSVFHYTDGVVFTVVFALALHHLLPWRNTERGNLAKGLFFGTVLAIISCGFMVPLVYFPQFHPGFFSLNLGWKVILAIFLWHWVYGLHLGLIYNPLPADALEHAVPLPNAEIDTQLTQD